MSVFALVAASIFAGACPTGEAQAARSRNSREPSRPMTWRWSGVGAAELVVALTRGDVRIVRTREPGIDVHAVGLGVAADGAVVRMEVGDVNGVLRVVDRYPAAAPMWITRECLPDGEHGAFWAYADRVSVVVRVPAGVRVAASTMSGSVQGR